MPPIIDRKKCNGCAVCDRTCAVDVIDGNAEGPDWWSNGLR